MDFGCAQNRTTKPNRQQESQESKNRCYLSISAALDEALQALPGSDNGDL